MIIDNIVFSEAEYSVSDSFAPFWRITLQCKIEDAEEIEDALAFMFDVIEWERDEDTISVDFDNEADTEEIALSEFKAKLAQELENGD